MSNISPNYVDGLEQRIKELEAKLDAQRWAANTFAEKIAILEAELEKECDTNALAQNRIAELESQLAEQTDWNKKFVKLPDEENQKLREALQANTYQDRKCKYSDRGHRCSWREIAEAMIQRSKQALKGG